MGKFNELKFVRVIDPNVFMLIPRYLFEQIKEFDKESIDNLYRFGSSIVTVSIQGPNGEIIRMPNEFVHIIVMADNEGIMKGFVWAEIDAIERHIFVQAISVDKKYQSQNGEIENKITDYLFKLTERRELKNLNIRKKIVMATIHEKAFEKYGWKRCKRILMEKENERNAE